MACEECRNKSCKKVMRDKLKMPSIIILGDKMKIDLDTIENDLQELCEDNDVMRDAIRDYFLNLKDKGIDFKKVIE